MVSKTTLYYRANKKARDVKKDYDTKYHQSPERKSYRAALGRIRYRRKLKGNSMDLSHTKGGRVVLENRSKNRGRNGTSGKSTLK